MIHHHHDIIDELLDDDALMIRPIGWGVLAILVAVALLFLLFPRPARAQDTPVAYCIPTVYGKQWPGTESVGPTRTNNGWYGFVFCDGGSGRLVPRSRVCAHGECLAQTTIGNNIGALFAAAAASAPSERGAVFESSPAAKQDYACGPWPVPTNGVPVWVAPASSAPPIPVPAAGTPRAAICADMYAAMRAAWPIAAVTPPPPPPPPAACAAQPVNWGACTAAYAGGASGTSTQLADTTAPDTGTVTVACTNGALAQSLASCVTAPPPGAPVYVVTPDGTKPERQWFLAVQGTDGKWKRSTSPGGTTPVGGTCDCVAINILEFNITRYCKVPVVGVNAVAACMVKK